MKGGPAVASQRMREALSLSEAAEEHLRQCQACDQGPDLCQDGRADVLVAKAARALALAHVDGRV